jgi:hypothetical protein
MAPASTAAEAGKSGVTGALTDRITAFTRKRTVLAGFFGFGFGFGFFEAKPALAAGRAEESGRSGQ